MPFVRTVFSWRWRATTIISLLMILGCSRCGAASAIPASSETSSSLGAAASLAPTTADRSVLEGSAIPPTRPPTVTSVALTPRWKTYVNERYHYAIRLPAEWPEGVALSDGSGMQIDVADAGVHVHIQAYPDSALEPTPIVATLEFPEILHAKLQWITLANGYSGRLNMRQVDGMIFYELIRYTNTRNVHVTITMPVSYFVPRERLLLAIVTSLTTAGSSYERLEATPTPIPQLLLDDPQVTTGVDCQRYTSSRYGYSIRFPAAWPVGPESDNGAARTLYIGHPELGIYVDAVRDRYDPAIEFMIPGTRPVSITLDTGKQADLFMARAEGIVVYHVVRVDHLFIYRFTAMMPEAWYQENAALIEQVAKSLETS